jgi:hypothetical protein
LVVLEMEVSGTICPAGLALQSSCCPPPKLLGLQACATSARVPSSYMDTSPIGLRTALIKHLNHLWALTSNTITWVVRASTHEF